MTETDRANRKPWNAGFRIDDIVCVRQDGGAPLDWCGDWVPGDAV